MTKSYEIRFTKNAGKEYNKLKKNEQALSKIKTLLESISETPDYGISHPERLKGFGEKLIYLRRLNEKDRLTYQILKDNSGEISFIRILAFIGHYDDR